ncbi:MAG TPA: carbohydrate-binding family 9-like protein [Bryobacteraceae bacterium]|nr:carbohydrate-binding family 9-like protein [Bryobacteraceae bacterium]
MKSFLLLFLAASTAALADGPGVILSHYSKSDFELTTDPDAKPWKGIQGVFADRSSLDRPLPAYRTEIRSRWTDRNLYLLFICPYETLHLKPNPSTTAETNNLWNWDVAEFFVGTDFQNIRRYKEFEISPQAEWVDLDIDKDSPHMEAGIKWDSGIRAAARIDAQKKIWYGVMRIPLASIDSRPPANGLEMRANLYRCQGADPNRKYIAWQPTHSPSFHEPEAFGRLRLVGK